MKKKQNNQSGEGYVDSVVSVLVFAMITVILLNLFSMITLYQKLNSVATATAEYAAANGSVGADTQAYFENLCDVYGIEASVTFAGSTIWRDSTYVQLGEEIRVSVTAQSEVLGNGEYGMSVPLTARCATCSAKYWKEGELP